MIIWPLLILIALLAIALTLILIFTPISCPKPAPCPPCKCPGDHKRILAAYYTFYQDPNCSGDCHPKPCTATILSDPEVLNSKLNLVIINPIAPATDGGVTLSYINGVYTGEKSESDTYYPPPPAIKQGIDDLHSHGKQVILSFIPGSSKDRWGQGDAWMAKFKAACQKIMTDWDIDGFDWDCETDGCPPRVCGGSWTQQSCQDLALNIFKTFKTLKPNPGRGNPNGTAVVTWTGELTWQLQSLDNMSPFVPYVDFFLTMNENYSVVDPHALYKNMLNFSEKGFPISRIVNGIKAGGCWPGSNGDGTDLQHFETLLTTKIDGNQTLTDVSAGWSIWNLSRDFGCAYGRTTTPAKNPDNTWLGDSKTCFTCKSGDCPKGVGWFSAGDQWSFLKLAEKYFAK